MSSASLINTNDVNRKKKLRSSPGAKMFCDALKSIQVTENENFKMRFNREIQENDDKSSEPNQCLKESRTNVSVYDCQSYPLSCDNHLHNNTNSVDLQSRTNICNSLIHREFSSINIEKNKKSLIPYHNPLNSVSQTFNSRFKNAEYLEKNSAKTSDSFLSPVCQNISDSQNINEKRRDCIEKIEKDFKKLNTSKNFNCDSSEHFINGCENKTDVQGFNLSNSSITYQFTSNSADEVCDSSSLCSQNNSFKHLDHNCKNIYLKEDTSNAKKLGSSCISYSSSNSSSVQITRSMCFNSKKYTLPLSEFVSSSSDSDVFENSYRDYRNIADSPTDIIASKSPSLPLKQVIMPSSFCFNNPAKDRKDKVHFQRSSDNLLNDYSSTLNRVHFQTPHSDILKYPVENCKQNRNSQKDSLKNLSENFCLSDLHFENILLEPSKDKWENMSLKKYSTEITNEFNLPSSFRAGNISKNIVDNDKNLSSTKFSIKYPKKASMLLSEVLDTQPSESGSSVNQTIVSTVYEETFAIKSKKYRVTLNEIHDLSFSNSDFHCSNGQNNKELGNSCTSQEFSLHRLNTSPAIPIISPSVAENELDYSLIKNPTSETRGIQCNSDSFNYNLHAHQKVSESHLHSLNQKEYSCLPTTALLTSHPNHYKLSKNKISEVNYTDPSTSIDSLQPASYGDENISAESFRYHFENNNSEINVASYIQTLNYKEKCTSPEPMQKDVPYIIFSNRDPVIESKPSHLMKDTVTFSRSDRDHRKVKLQENYVTTFALNHKADLELKNKASKVPKQSLRLRDVLPPTSLSNIPQFSEQYLNDSREDASLESSELSDEFCMQSSTLPLYNSFSTADRNILSIPQIDDTCKNINEYIKETTIANSNYSHLDEEPPQILNSMGNVSNNSIECLVYHSCFESEKKKLHATLHCNSEEDRSDYNEVVNTVLERNFNLELNSNHVENTFENKAERDLQHFLPETTAIKEPVSYYSANRNYSCLPDYPMENLFDFYLPGFIDSHCHIDLILKRKNFFGSFTDFRKEYSSEFPPSYKGCIAIFCYPDTFDKSYLWKKHVNDDVWLSFGCHPKRAGCYNDKIENLLIKALKHSQVRALGEIGLDYSNGNSCLVNIQQSVFRRQLQIAVHKNLPLVIHCRDAYEDCMHIMKLFVPKNYKIHMHCFKANWEWAQKFLTEFPNLCIGITNVVTYSEARVVHEVAAEIPLERLLLETDAPYFVPNALSKNNLWTHPGMAIHVAAQVSSLKSIPLSEVLHITHQNTIRLYNL